MEALIIMCYYIAWFFIILIIYKEVLCFSHSKLNTLSSIRCSGLFIITFASILYAWNLRCFAKTAGLFPGGFSGLSLLLQEIIIKFLHITIPFQLYLILHLIFFLTYIAFKYIGKKFTIYSIIVIFLSSIFVDILPPYVFTNDVLLISVFGGIINGFAISLCLNAGATTGGTDFISIFLSHEKME